MKNSLVEQHSSVSDLAELEEIPVFRPSEEEFQEPVAYIEKIYRESGYKYGVAKIVPPASFRPPLCFPADLSKPLPVRFQEL